ncbi:MAG: hypothetical protein HY063_14195 [Bacteroidetes bacterium]|nr:hypothetical protein [Bacteroidota bacterium]
METEKIILENLGKISEPKKQKPDPYRYPPKPGPDNPDPEKNVPTMPDEDNDPTVPKPHTINPIKPDPTKSPKTFI